MVQQADYRTNDTLPPSADVDKCEECDELATLAYRWDWGATGIVCAEHGALLQQKSVALSRGIVVHPRQLAAPAPIGRDERVQLTAQTIVLAEDLKAAQSAGEQLHGRNKDLQVQLSAAVVRTRELNAQLVDVGDKLRQSEQQRGELSAENGRLLVELDRLKHLDALVSERTQREAHERGIDGGSSVDG